MIDPTQKRIERAWGKSKEWIAEVTGLATETYLINVPVDSLPQAFQDVSQKSLDFRISVISGESEEKSQFVSLESIKNNIQQFLDGQIAGLNINFTARLIGFDLDIHLIIQKKNTQLVDLEFIWWSDQAFPDDVNNYDRFKSVLLYFIELKDIFHASKMFIGPENYEKPGAGSIWVEI